MDKDSSFSKAGEKRPAALRQASSQTGRSFCSVPCLHNNRLLLLSDSECQFTGTETRKIGNAGRLILPLTLRSNTGKREGIFIPLDDHDQTVLRLLTLNDTRVTSEFVTDVNDEGELADVSEIVNDLCYLLSVARGTKIQWVYRHVDQCSAVSRTHHARITKPFVNLAVIDPRATANTDTKRFIEVTYPDFASRARKYKLQRGPIDAYLDAKAEADYLEVRGAKLAVVMELVKNVFLKAEGLRKAMSFRTAITEMCARLGVSAGKKEIALFVACRNSLVHECDFYLRTATKHDRKKTPPRSTPAEEYFFLLNFLDRVFLRLVGYNGPYLDWRLPRQGDVPTATI